MDFFLKPLSLSPQLIPKDFPSVIVPQFIPKDFSITQVYSTRFFKSIFPLPLVYPFYPSLSDLPQLSPQFSPPDLPQFSLFDLTRIANCNRTQRSKQHMKSDVSEFIYQSSNSILTRIRLVLSFLYCSCVFSAGVFSAF